MRVLFGLCRRCFSGGVGGVVGRKAFQLHVQKVAGEGAHPLQPLAKTIARLQGEIKEIRDFSRELKDDAEVQLAAESDVRKIESEIEGLAEEYVEHLLDKDRDPLFSRCDELLLEVSAGVGGQEAMLFSQDLFEMYSTYIRWRGWGSEILQFDRSELGGLRHGTLLVNSPEAYRGLYLEAGVHRVQRVPKTEKAGRIHTSTATLSVLPSVPSYRSAIPPSDIKMETKRASGAGGQHVNKTESAVRLTHLPTGLVVDCQTERSQIQNRSSALRILESRLYRLQIEQEEKSSRAQKKSQVGMSERSDKIRTFNFLQDRVTDHRVGVTSHNAKVMMGDGEELEKFLEQVREKVTENEIDEALAEGVA